MFKTRTIYSFCLLISFSSCWEQVGSSVDNESNSKSITFQAGKMGHKPWDHHASYAVKVNFNRAVFGQLLYFDNTYKIRPGIIQKWEWNPKNNSYLLTMDNTLTFGPKRPLRITDIEFAILKRYISQRHETNPIFFRDILGVEKLTRGQPFLSGMCSGIKILSATKLEIKLKNPNITFLYTLGALTPPVAPVEDFEKDLMTFRNTPRGLGNYKVVWSDPKSSLVKLSRKSFVRGHVKSNSPFRIDFYNHGNPLENGVDLGIGAGANGLKGTRGYTVTRSPIPTGLQVIDFNYSSKYGKSKLFRKAIAMAIHRRNLFKSYDFSREAFELVPSKYYGHSGQTMEYAPGKSKNILNKYFPELTTPKKTLKGIFHGTKVGGKLPRYIRTLQDQLSQVGVNIDFKRRDWTVIKKEELDTVFSVYGVVTSFVDPLSPFAHYLKGSPFENHTDITDKKANLLFQNASKSTNITQRAKIISELSLHFQSEIRQIVLEERHPSVVYSKRIRGIGMESYLTSIDFGLVEVN